MNNSVVKGAGVALVTPFDSNGNPDKAALKRLVDYVVQGGIDFLVALGTTGEGVTLEQKEREEVLDWILEFNNNRLPIVLGLGGNNTLAIQRQLKTTHSKDYAAILSVCPYYNKPQQNGLFEHFKAIATESPFPVILYNVPGRTASNLTAETTLKLANEFQNIIAIKEASGNLFQIMEIIRQKPENFRVLSGDDNLTLPMIAIGAEGVISVSGQLLPTPFSRMVNFALKGRFDAARDIHYKLYEITELLFAEGNPSGVKQALNLINICEPYVRLPLIKVSSVLRDHLNEAINKIHIEYGK